MAAISSRRMRMASSVPRGVSRSGVRHGAPHPQPRATGEDLLAQRMRVDDADPLLAVRLALTLAGGLHAQDAQVEEPHDGAFDEGHVLDVLRRDGLLHPAQDALAELQRAVVQRAAQPVEVVPCTPLARPQLHARISGAPKMESSRCHATIATRQGRISGLNVACSGGVSHRVGNVGTVASCQGARFVPALAQPRMPHAPGVPAQECAWFHRPPRGCTVLPCWKRSARSRDRRPTCGAIWARAMSRFHACLLMHVDGA